MPQPKNSKSGSPKPVLIAFIPFFKRIGPPKTQFTQYQVKVRFQDNISDIPILMHERNYIIFKLFYNSVFKKPIFFLFRHFRCRRDPQIVTKSSFINYCPIFISTSYHNIYLNKYMAYLNQQYDLEAINIIKGIAYSQLIVDEIKTKLFNTPDFDSEEIFNKIDVKGKKIFPSDIVEFLYVHRIASGDLLVKNYCEPQTAKIFEKQLIVVLSLNRNPPLGICQKLWLQLSKNKGYLDERVFINFIHRYKNKVEFSPEQFEAMCKRITSQQNSLRSTIKIL